MSRRVVCRVAVRARVACRRGRARRVVTLNEPLVNFANLFITFILFIIVPNEGGLSRYRVVCIARRSVLTSEYFILKLYTWDTSSRAV